ncbi:hypothetical protein TELCIR_11959, partial [Teladorsagia circumcincta]
MAYFRSFFGGGGAEAEEEDGAEIVEKMVERAETCTALEDRRDALRALRGMAKKLRLAVGTMGMNVYMDVLEKERSNQELLAITLEILVAVLSSDDESTDDDELGERLAEVMLKKPVFIPSLLTAVDDYDITVRRTSLEQLVDRRVGRDTVIGAIEGLSRTEQFVRAAQKPQPLTKTPNELFLDYHFIKMFKSSE